MPSFQWGKDDVFYQGQGVSKIEKVSDDHARGIMIHLPIFFSLDDPTA